MTITPTPAPEAAEPTPAEAQPRWLRFDEPDDDKIAEVPTSATSIAVVALVCAFLSVAFAGASLALAIAMAGPYGYGYR